MMFHFSKRLSSGDEKRNFTYQIQLEERECSVSFLESVKTFTSGMMKRAKFQSGR